MSRLNLICLAVLVVLGLPCVSAGALTYTPSADTFVYSTAETGPYGGNTTVWLKRGSGATSHRKGYLLFDFGYGLSDYNSGRVIKEARLDMEFVNSGAGAIIGTPTFDFQVYGLTDETLEPWADTGASGICWNRAGYPTAPANNTADGHLVDLTKATSLGTFSVSGKGVGTQTLSTPQLANFLQSNTNDNVTLIVVRDTVEGAGGNYVHAFVADNHASFTPATLTIDHGAIAADPFQTVASSPNTAAGEYQANLDITSATHRATKGGPIVGFQGNWESGTTSQIKPQMENLSFGPGNKFLDGLESSGGSVQIDVSPYDDQFRHVYRDVVAYDTSDTYYISGLMAAPADSDGEGLMGFVSATSSVRFGFDSQRAVLRLGEDASGGFKPSGGSSHNLPYEYFAPGETALFVAKVEVNDSGNDTVSLWFNPGQYTSEAMAGPADLVVNSVDCWNNTAPAGRLLMSTEAFGGAGTIKFDEPRFATTWKDAVPIADERIRQFGFQEDTLPTASYTHLGGEARQGSPTGTGSTDTNIRVGYHTDSTVESMRPLLAFDLSDLDPNHALDEVTLRLTIDSWGGSDLGDLQLHAILPGDLGETMVEGQSSWTNRNSGDPWTTLGGDFDPTALVTIADFTSTVFPNGSEVIFESTPELVAAAQAALDAGRPLELIMLAPDIEGGAATHFVRWRSDDWGSSLQEIGTRPLLSVSYLVPEPSSVALALFGLLALAGCRRRRK